VASSSSQLGLIAGSSQMPRVVAREAKAAGCSVHAAAIHGITDPALEECVDELRWLQWSDMQGFFALLQDWQAMGITEAIMAGKVEQQRMYERDASGDMEKLIEGLPTGHTDQLLSAVAGVLSGAGIELLPSTRYLGRYMPGAGLVAGRALDEREREDVEHGWSIAKALGTHDIGQTVVVKEKAVVAVEGMEGTDACIRRAGELAGPGTVVVKVAKPDQDLRFDVPVIGAQTIGAMRDAGAGALAFQADITVLFDAADIEAAVGNDIGLLARTDD
jgi:DUF1009 family protein